MCRVMMVNTNTGKAPVTAKKARFGAAYRIRTYDLIITNDALYQLS